MIISHIPPPLPGYSRVDIPLDTSMICTFYILFAGCNLYGTDVERDLFDVCNISSQSQCCSSTRRLLDPLLYVILTIRSETLCCLFLGKR